MQEEEKRIKGGIKKVKGDKNRKSRVRKKEKGIQGVM